MDQVEEQGLEVVPMVVESHLEQDFETAVAGIEAVFAIVAAIVVAVDEEVGV